MKNIMLQTQVYQYAVGDWGEKKHRLLKLIDHTKFQYNVSFHTDSTNYSLPNVHEGALVIAPSNVLHFTYPSKSKKIGVL